MTENATVSRPVDGLVLPYPALAYPWSHPCADPCESYLFDSETFCLYLDVYDGDAFAAIEALNIFTFMCWHRTVELESEPGGLLCGSRVTATRLHAMLSACSRSVLRHSNVLV
jgi:hypothetical protein